MTPKELLAKINDKRAEANIDVSLLKPGVQSTAEGLRAVAAKEAEILSDEYMTLVAKKCVIVAVNGPGCAKFVEVAKTKGWAAINYTALLDRLTANIKQRSNRDDFSNQEFWMFVDELNRLKLDYKILQIPMPKIDHTKEQVYDQPTAVAVRKIVMSNYGDSLFSAICMRDIGAAALAGNFDGITLPVVLYNCDGETDNHFLPTPISCVTVDIDATDESIAKTLQGVNVKKVKKPTSEVKGNE